MVWRPVIAQLYIAVFGVFLLAGCGSDSDDRPAEEAAVRPARLVVVEMSSNAGKLSFPAIVEASESVDLTFQVGGQIREIAVIESSEVREGQIIARLNQRDFRNTLSSAEAQHRSAEEEYARAKRLSAQNAIARSVVAQRKAQRDVTLASLDTARKALEDTVLVSPFAGIVAAIHAVNFQNIAAQSKVVTLQTSGAAEAVIQIPARLVANSEQVDVVETVVILDAAPRRRLAADFLSVVTQADPSTQTFEMHFLFTPPEDLRILPGMTGRVEARFRFEGPGGATDSITVPLSAIGYDGQSPYVWLVDETQMTVSRRLIALGEGIGDTLRVVSGLSAGEVIVGAGVSHLHEGMQVRRFEQ